MSYLSEWHTSNGTFITDKVNNNLEFIFPEFSESRTVTIKQDIFELPKLVLQLVYDLILGEETITKLSVVLNFIDKTITKDQQKLPMQTLRVLAIYQNYTAILRLTPKLSA